MISARFENSVAQVADLLVGLLRVDVVGREVLHVLRREALAVLGRPALDRDRVDAAVGAGDAHLRGHRLAVVQRPHPERVEVVEVVIGVRRIGVDERLQDAFLPRAAERRAGPGVPGRGHHRVVGADRRVVARARLDRDPAPGVVLEVVGPGSEHRVGRRGGRLALGGRQVRERRLLLRPRRVRVRGRRGAVGGGLDHVVGAVAHRLELRALHVGDDDVDLHRPVVLRVLVLREVVPLLRQIIDRRLVGNDERDEIRSLGGVGHRGHRPGAQHHCQQRLRCPGPAHVADPPHVDMDPLRGALLAARGLESTICPLRRLHSVSQVTFSRNHAAGSVRARSRRPPARAPRRPAGSRSGRRRSRSAGAGRRPPGGRRSRPARRRRWRSRPGAASS